MVNCWQPHLEGTQRSRAVSPRRRSPAGQAAPGRTPRGDPAHTARRRSQAAGSQPVGAARRGPSRGEGCGRFTVSRSSAYSSQPRHSAAAHACTARAARDKRTRSGPVTSRIDRQSAGVVSSHRQMPAAPGQSFERDMRGAAMCRGRSASKNDERPRVSGNTALCISATRPSRRGPCVARQPRLECDDISPARRSGAGRLPFRARSDQSSSCHSSGANEDMTGLHHGVEFLYGRLCVMVLQSKTV